MALPSQTTVCYLCGNMNNMPRLRDLVLVTGLVNSWRQEVGCVCLKQNPTPGKRRHKWRWALNTCSNSYKQKLHLFPLPTLLSRTNSKLAPSSPSSCLIIESLSSMCIWVLSTSEHFLFTLSCLFLLETVWNDFPHTLHLGFTSDAIVTKATHSPFNQSHLQFYISTSPIPIPIFTSCSVPLVGDKKLQCYPLWKSQHRTKG